MKKKTVKRRQYIVDPDFQYGMIRKIAFLAALVIVMSLLFLTLVNYLYGDLQVGLLQPHPFASDESLDAMAGQRTLLNLLWPVLGVCVLVTLAIAFTFGAIVSHRMAGPIFRFRRVLGDMAEGDFRGTLQLRKKDEFKSIAEAINTLKKSLRVMVLELKSACQALESGDPSAAAAAKERLDRTLARFQTDN